MHFGSWTHGHFDLYGNSGNVFFQKSDYHLFIDFVVHSERVTHGKLQSMSCRCKQREGAMGVVNCTRRVTSNHINQSGHASNL